MTPRFFTHWLTLLGCLFITSAAVAQTITLSAPASGTTYVDNVSTVLSISGESGAIQSVKLVYTYTSGPSYQYVGQAFTLAMVSTASSQSFSIPLATVSSSALFSSVSLPNGGPGLPDGVYSVYAQYTRGVNGSVVKSTTVNSVTTDSSTLPVRLSYIRTPTAVDATTDTITLAAHGYSTGVPVQVERTNLSSTTTYYVSVVDASTFKLSTTPDGANIADITTTVVPVILNPLFQNAKSVSVNTATDVITLAKHGFADSDMVQIHGTNATSSTVYFISKIDNDTFKLATTPGGGTYADFTSAPAPVLYSSQRDGSPAIQFASSSSQVIPGKYFRIPYNFGESFKGGSASVKFTGPIPASNATTTLTLVNVIRNNDFTIDRSNVTTTSPVAATTAATIPDGNYTVVVSYSDLNNHAAATATLTNLTLDSVTQAPRFGMLDLRTGSTYTNVLTSGQTITSSEPMVYYSLPEEPLPGSVKLTFTNDGTGDVTSFALPDAAAAHAYNLSSSGLPVGSYTVTLSYRDWVGNTESSVSAANVTFDLTTIAPTLDLGSMSTVGPKFNIAYTLPETPKAGTVKLIFSGSSTVTLNLTDDLSGSFELDTADLAKSGTSILSASSPTLPAGTYNVTLQYRDFAGNAAASVLQSGFRVSTTTAVPAVSLPVTGSSYNSIPISYALPEAAMAGSVILSFRSGGSEVASAGMIDTTPSATAFINPKVNPAGTSPFISAATTASSGFLPDGTYDVVLTYRNNLGAPFATRTVTGIVVDTTTLTPTLAKPIAGTSNSFIPIDYTLPEEASSVGLLFEDATTNTVIKTIAMSSARAVRFNLDPQDLAGSSSNIVSASPGNTLADGIYRVRLTYVDAVINPASFVLAANVRLDTATQPPSLTTPLTNARTRSNIRVTYSLPETPKAGSVELKLYGATTISLQLLDGLTGDFLLDATHIAPGSGSIVSATSPTIPDGVYTFVLSYQDVVGNIRSAATAANVTIDSVTEAPVLSSPLTGSVAGNLLNISYTLPEAPLAGSAQLRFEAVSGGADVTINLINAQTESFTIDRSNLAAAAAHFAQKSSNVLTNGTYKVTLSYQDSAANAVASASSTTVMLGGPPLLSTPTLTVTGTTTATLDLTVSPSSFPTVVSLYLGNTLIDTRAVAAGTMPVTVSQAIIGLTQDTSYAASVSATNVIGSVSSTPVSFRTDNADAETEAPTLLAPVAGAPAASSIAVSYTLPEVAKAGTVKLSFVGASSSVLTMSTAQAVSFTLDPTNIAGSSTAIVSASRNTLPDGVYAVTLSYQDAKGNAAASVTVGNVILDRTTKAPLLVSPATGSELGADFVLNYVLPETPQPGSVTLKFTAMLGGADVTLNLNDATLKSITLSRGKLTASAADVIHSSADLLTDGIYNVELSYQDSLGNDAVTTINQHVTFGTLPEFGLPVVTVTGPTTATLDVTVAPRRVDTTVEFFIGSTSLGTSVVPAGSLPATVSKALTSLSSNTSYAVSISAVNVFGSNASTPVIFTTTNADAETQAPTLTSPVTGDAVGKTLTLAYSLPEAPKPGTVQVTFVGPVTATFPLSDATSGTVTVDPTNTVSNVAGFTAAPVSRLPDGVYSVVLSYRDATGNAPASATAGNVTIDTATATPTLVSPALNAVLGAKFTVTYTLPEAPKSGTVALSFHPVAGGSDVTIQLNDEAGASFDLDRGNLAAATLNVVTTSAPTLADGTYDVTLTYQDELGNAAAFVQHAGVVFGLAPIMNPPNVAVLSSSSARLTVGVAAGAGNTVVAFFLGADFQGTTMVPAGTSANLEKIFTGLDAGRSYAATVQITNPFGSVTSAPRAFSTFSTRTDGGDSTDPAGYKSRVAVGRFERVAAGSSLPADATYYSFGVPAINDAGAVAFLAKVRSSVGTKAAIVAGDPLKIIAAAGDAAPGVAGATFARFTDPVIDANGCVAFQATLAGTAVTAQDAISLWTNAPDGELRLVARVGDVAPEAGTARLRAFTSFSLQSTTGTQSSPTMSEVVFTGFLQVDRKASVSTANNYGIWSVQFATDGTIAASKCLLREGVTKIGGSPVRLFRALDVVKDSPGQGRSHLAPGTVSLLATLTSGREVIVEASSAAGVEVVASNQTTLQGTHLGGKVLKKLGVPALNVDCDHLAFVGSLVPGTDGITSKNCTGIFYGEPDLASLAMTGARAPGITNAVFAAFRDPVMERVSGGIAFLSTLRGKGVSAGTAQTLWWTKQGALTLLARSGDALPGAPGTKLKAFASIAFPTGLGPVFVGTLTSGTTAVKKTDDTGLWVANATTGELTLLLRKGQKLTDGVGLLKTVKAFEVLKPVAGSPGATRSYNAAATLVCRVIFEDWSESVMTFSAVP